MAGIEGKGGIHPQAGAQHMQGTEKLSKQDALQQIPAFANWTDTASVNAKAVTVENPPHGNAKTTQREGKANEFVQNMQSGATTDFDALMQQIGRPV